MLFHAAAVGRFSHVQYLVGLKVFYPWEKNWAGRSYVDVCIQSHRQIAKYLLAWGAPRLRTQSGRKQYLYRTNGPGWFRSTCRVQVSEKRRKRGERYRTEIAKQKWKRKAGSKGKGKNTHQRSHDDTRSASSRHQSHNAGTQGGTWKQGQGRGSSSQSSRQRWKVARHRPY